MSKNRVSGSDTESATSNDEKNTRIGFNRVWAKLPHISLYQMSISATAGYCCMINGLWAMYPNFAQYKTPARCQSVFDGSDLYGMSFDQVHNLTTSLPCGEHVPDSEKLDACYACDLTTFDFGQCDDGLSFDGLYACLSQPNALDEHQWNKCDDYVYDKSLRPGVMSWRGEEWNSVVSEFGWVCDKDLASSLITSLGMVGKFIGALTAGWYADRFGRKNCIMVFTVVHLVGALVMALVVNEWVFTAMRIFCMGVAHVAWIAFISYSVEMLGPSKRAFSGALSHVYYGIGYIATSGIGYWVPHWQDFTMVIVILIALGILLFPFFPESAAWQFSRERYAAGRKNLHHFAMKTDTELDDALIDDVVEDIKNQRNERTDERSFSIVDLFRHKNLRSITFAVGVSFLVNTMVYYGLSYNAAHLPGSLYVNNAVNGVLETLAYVACLWLLDLFGRRMMLGWCMIAGGACCLSSMALLEVDEMTSVMEEAAKWLSFGGKLFISASFCTVYVFSAELYPTDIRTIGVGCGSMFGRIGGFAAPLMIEVQFIDGFSWLPLTIFGVMAVLSGIWCLFLPETTGLPILRTIEEAEFYYENRGKVMSDVRANEIQNTESGASSSL